MSDKKRSYFWNTERVAWSFESLEYLSRELRQVFEADLRTRGAISEVAPGCGINSFQQVVGGGFLKRIRARRWCALVTGFCRPGVPMGLDVGDGFDEGLFQ
jgi:hypothetical protein